MAETIFPQVVIIQKGLPKLVKRLMFHSKTREVKGAHFPNVMNLWTLIGQMVHLCTKLVLNRCATILSRLVHSFCFHCDSEFMTVNKAITRFPSIQTNFRTGNWTLLIRRHLKKDIAVEFSRNRSSNFMALKFYLRKDYEL